MNAEPPAPDDEFLRMLRSLTAGGRVVAGKRGQLREQPPGIN
jgi:hypothetical protein